MIAFENGTFEVDAEIVAAGLRLEPAEVMDGLREGTITTVSEAGIDEDAGRHRLTFFGARRRLRLTLDETGAIVMRSAADYRAPFSGFALGEV